MKNTTSHVLCFLLISYFSYSQKSFVSSKDVFGTRAFVENKGQFNSSINSSEDIKFAYETSNEHIYFTNNGLVYKLIKRFPLTHEQKEEIEHGKKVKVKLDEIHYVSMNWIGSNPNIQIIESEKQTYYFTYGGPELNSCTYKKITYKNVYNKIDIEYTIPDDKDYGIKYNVILHPGANPNSIKIAYTGDVNEILEKNGEIIIKTPVEDITEHSPKSFYDDNEAVSCVFKINNDIVSFDFPKSYQNNRILIVDPFVTTLNLPSNNYGFDVDYDYAGNLFVYGGLTPNKVAKYSSGGVLLWVFNGILPGVPWNSDGAGSSLSGNFVVQKFNGKTYIGTPFEFIGSRTIRLDQNGVYDNYVTTPNAQLQEIWDMGFHCGSGKIYGFGGGGNINNIPNINACLIDQLTGTVSPANFTGIPGTNQDIMSNAIDDNGDIFVYFCGPNVNNRILKVNMTFNGYVWFVPSNYNTFSEALCKSSFIGAGFPVPPLSSSNGFNALAVNNNYLFFYDGFNLAAYNKNTGTILGFTTLPGLTVKQQGGIAVDDCNNLYLGGNGNIRSYNFNGTSFSALPNIPLGVVTPNQYVCDIKLDRRFNLLYVSGSGFAGTYNAAASWGCSGTNQFNLITNCQGNNNGTGVASLTTNIANPLINYIWTGIGGTVSATYSTGATTNTVPNLPNGTYTIQMQINAPCGPAYVNTISINCCQGISVVQTVTQISCSNTLNAVALSITGGGTVTPIVNWSPTPLSISGNSLNASGLPVGINTISVNYGFGCLSTLTINILPPPPPITFSITNLSGSYTISCLNPTINLQAISNYTYGTLNYNWSSPSFTANTSTVSITQSNIITITAIDPATGCSMTQTIAVGINTIAPSNSVNPSSQFITCISGVPITFSGTCSNPSVNIQNDWYSPLNPLPGGVPIATSNNTISILSGLIPPGVYTLQTTNLVNGCKAYKTVTVTSLDAWPTYSVGSTTGFSVGCNPLHQTTLSIINPVSTQTPPATCSYTFLAPSFTGAVTPSVVLGANTSTVTQTPGTWTIIVQDNSNFCRTTISIPIIQNTVAPNILATHLTQTLTCYNPTVLAIGTSTTSNTIITWNIPQNPPLLSTTTVEIGPASGPNTSTTSLTYANYTVVATNTLNACVTTSVVQINQNFKPPISSPTISIGTATAIYCTSQTNPVVLTTGNSTTTSGGGALAFVANPCWEGPSPQIPICGVSSYSCYTAGIYSLTVMDNYNGCKKTGTINVLDKTQPPILENENATSNIDCGTEQAKLLTVITGTSSGLRYLYFNYPPGAAFNPTNAILININPFLSGTSSNSVTVSNLGMYQYVVTNTLTGCQAYGIFNVNAGSLSSDFMPDVQTGYAPLTVVFTPTNYSGLNGITNIWSFGNGILQTHTANINPTTIYYSPGTYTAILISQKGSCVDTTYKIIKVELPSKLETPNIFTPNGDGSNDVFFLKTANLGEINTIIFDRWGNKVYEVNSSTGNIAWDGKNLNGKDCTAGVYFYVITAKGNDAKDYKAKGNVSLFR